MGGFTPGAPGAEGEGICKPGIHGPLARENASLAIARVTINSFLSDISLRISCINALIIGKLINIQFWLLL
jgi:hypothetical protein